ncbi:MAG: GumC family protein [Planctomycetota bacterium]
MPETPDVIAPQQDPREALSEILKAIRRNRARVVFTTLVTLMLGYGLSLVWPNKYESYTTFLMRDDASSAVTSRLDELTGLGEIKRTEALQAELRSRKRVEAVLNELQWPEWLDTAGSENDRRELLLKLSENLKVNMAPDVTGKKNVTITFAWTSALKAADFCNGLRNAWIQRTMEDRRRDLEDEYERQKAILRDREADYAEALEAGRKYAEENQVSKLLSVDANIEMKALYLQDQTRLVGEQQSLLGEIERLRATMEATVKEIPAGVQATNPEQATLLLALQQAKAELEKLTDPVKGYKAEHPARRAAQSKLDALLAELASKGWSTETETGEPKLVTNPAYYALGAELQLKQAEEAAVRAQLQSVEQSMAEAQANLDRLPTVTAEIGRLQGLAESYKLLAALQREAIQPIAEEVQRARAGTVGADSRAFGSEGGAFEILDTAVPAEQPVLPIATIIMAVSLVLGILLGALGPVLREMTRSSFGTVKEVSRSLGVPVLGAVDLILTTKDLRARAVQRALTYATMLLVLVALGTALFIYRYHQDVLPGELLRALRALRMTLT